MKRFILFLGSLILSTNAASAAAGCFIVQENGVTIRRDGDCKTRYAPCSSFKIPLALMGYDAGILQDETHPEWPFVEGYDDYLQSWKTPQNPTSWMKNSCVWYSQVLTPRLGADRFQNYVQKFQYGNQDVSGDAGQNNGLTHAWLSSSLEISPEEQVAFVEKLLFNTLPVSQHAQKMTKAIVYLEDLPHGWTLFGKTGSGYVLNADRTKNKDRKHGWFVGWIEKDTRKIIVVNHIVDLKKEDTHAGPRAKAQAKERMIEMIEEMAATGAN